MFTRSSLVILSTFVLQVAAQASPITPTPGEEAAREALGSRLPDAKLLWVSGDRIYFSPIENFSPQLVTEGGIPEGNPRWSPDGSKILYVKDPFGVWVMDADFTNRTEVIPVGDTASWTRDGQAITAVNASDRHQILRYDFADDAVTTLYDSNDPDYAGQFGAGAEHSQAAELHVGGRFILTFTLDNNHNTFIVDLQAKQHLLNADMDRGDCSPSWAPDGTYTTTTARTGNRPVLKTDFDASGPTLADSSEHWVGIGDVCGCSYYVHGHRVSEDGQWVAMGGLDRDENNREIYVWKIGDPESEAVRVTFETAEDQSPSLYVGQAVQPDGGTDGADGGEDAGGDADADVGEDADGGEDAGADAGADPGDVPDAGDLDDGGGGQDGDTADEVDGGGTGDGNPQIEGSCACGGRPTTSWLLMLVLLTAICRRSLGRCLSRVASRRL